MKIELNINATQLAMLTRAIRYGVEQVYNSGGETQVFLDAENEGQLGAADAMLELCHSFEKKLQPHLFTKELSYVASMMQRNDPNGDYCVDDLRTHPVDYIEVLEQWKEDCGDTELVPEWIDKCIDYLMLLTM